jgi:energy-converting hydrogenase Eha subunit C
MPIVHTSMKIQIVLSVAAIIIGALTTVLTRLPAQQIVHMTAL